MIHLPWGLKFGAMDGDMLFDCKSLIDDVCFMSEYSGIPLRRCEVEDDGERGEFSGSPAKVT